MASEKKVILIFTECEGKELINCNTESLVKIREKGVVLSNVTNTGSAKINASTGNKEGQTFWEVATAEKLIVGGLDEDFDIAVLDADSTPTGVEKTLAEALEKTGRTTLLVLVAQHAVFYYGINIAKGKVIDTEFCACTVAPTVAYIANFPIPENNKASILYDVLKDMNFKFKEVQKLQQAVRNMEAAVERSTRQPWDKHDCA